MLGRRCTLVATGAISTVGVIIELTSAIGAPACFSQFVVGKTIGAISVGLAANIVPIYHSETSTGAARGFVVSLYQNIMVIGFIAAAESVAGSSKLDDPPSYYIPMGLQLKAPTVLVVGRLFLPASPRWLAMKGRHEEAVASAGKLSGTPNNGVGATDYVDKLAFAIAGERASESSWLDLFHGADSRRTLLAVGVQCLQQAQWSIYTNNCIVPFLQANGTFQRLPGPHGYPCRLYSDIALGGLPPGQVRAATNPH